MSSDHDNYFRSNRYRKFVAASLAISRGEEQ